MTLMPPAIDPRIADGLSTLVLSTITEGAVITDAHRRAIYANAAFQTITGYSWAEIEGRSCSFLQGPGTSSDEIARMRQALDAGESFRGRLLNYRRDRSTFWNDFSIAPLRDAHGTVTHWVGLQRDVSYETGLEAALKYSQEFDQITGLPNRDATRAFLRTALARARHDGTSVAVVIGDIADFRRLNHLYGYSAGDVMLEELAFRVRGTTRSGDLFGRIAADEFALILTGIPQELEVAQSAARSAVGRVADVLRAPIEITTGQWWTPSISFGIAISPHDAREAEHLFATAESRRGTVLSPSPAASTF